MGFELYLVNSPPVAGMDDPREAQVAFFTQIGYYSQGYDPRTNARNIYESVPYRIFSDYFLRYPQDPHKVEDMSKRLKTTVATIYRHLNKIKRLDILDEVELEPKKGVKMTKGYRLRYGSFPGAWRIAETNIDLCMENYRELVDSVNEMYRGTGSRKGAAAGTGDEYENLVRPRAGRANLPFRLKVVDTIVDHEEDESHDLQLLTSLDYLSPRGVTGKTPKEIRKGVGYRLFMECFMERSDRLWSYDEMCTVLDTTFPTVSRYLNKLRALDVLDEVLLERGEDEPPKKGYRLRYGDLSKAWNHTEAQSRSAVKNYRKSVEHLAEAVRAK